MNTVTMSNSFKNRLYPRLPEIAERFGIAVNVLDEVGIRETLETMNREALNAGIIGYKEFFAVNTAPFPVVLRIVKEMGCGFDCNSEIDVLLAREAGAEVGDIMFTPNNTTAGEFEVTMDESDSVINLDDVSFLEHPIFDEYVPDTLCFRINPGPLRKDDSVISIPEEAKYGIMVSEINEACTRARSLGAKKFGIQTMICSNNFDYKNLLKTTEMLLGFVQKLRNNTGIHISFINIRACIGIPYKPTDRPFDLVKLFQGIAKLQRDFKAESRRDIDIYTGCGRCVTAPHGVFVNRAINRKMTYQEHIGIHTTIPSLMRPTMCDVYHHIEVVDRHGRLIDVEIAPKRVVNIVGPICENCDRLATQRELPFIHVGEEDGDFVVTHSTGAHSAATGFNHNGRPRPGTIMLRADNQIEWVEKPETIEDLLRRTRGL